MGQLLDLEALADFLAVVETGSITAASRRRAQPKQTVSRRIIRLEAALGIRLFERTARSLRLTSEGAVLQDRARRILADVEDTHLTLSDHSAVPQGVVRLSAPVLLGQAVLGAFAARVLAAHPKLALEIVLSDRRVNLVEDGFDAAIRVGSHEDSALISRVLATAETVLVAAPSAIGTWGMPVEPKDLGRYPCILFGETSGPGTWTLIRDGQAVTAPVTGRLAAASFKLCLDAAVAGAGVASVPRFIARPLIEGGTLVRVLPDWCSGQVPVRVVFSSRRLLSARLRTVLDEIITEFAELGPI